MAYPGVKSFVNQPTRIFVSSDNDTSTPRTGAYNQFTVNLQTPILGARRAQLLRCTIPNAPATGVTIPDYMCEFWYYQLTSATTAPSISNLKCIRLYPANFVPSSGYATYVKNQYFASPAALVTALNSAAGTGGDVSTYNPNWTAGDVSFSYSTATQQITMTGLTSGKYYAIAGYNDPNIKTNAALITVPLFSGGTSVQPYVLGYTMNLRVGYALSGQANAVQGTVGSSQNILYANLTNTAFAQNVGIPPDAFPDLVYTQNVYLYSSLCVGSSATSNRRNNLLSVAPITANQLVVSQYIALTLNYLNNIADTIYTISIEMRDDNDQPFYLNDNNTVNVELALSYLDV